MRRLDYDSPADETYQNMPHITWRLLIFRAHAQGVTYTKIAKVLRDAGFDVSTKSVQLAADRLKTNPTLHACRGCGQQTPSRSYCPTCSSIQKAGQLLPRQRERLEQHYATVRADPAAWQEARLATLMEEELETTNQHTRRRAGRRKAGLESRQDRDLLAEPLPARDVQRGGRHLQRDSRGGDVLGGLRAGSGGDPHPDGGPAEHEPGLAASGADPRRQGPQDLLWATRTTTEVDGHSMTRIKALRKQCQLVLPW